MRFIVLSLDDDRMVCRVKPADLLEFEGAEFMDVLDNLTEYNAEDYGRQQRD